MYIQNTLKQFAITILMISLTTIIMLFVVQFLGYRAVGLFYLINILFLSTLIGGVAQLANVLLSVYLWNYLFIPPRFTFAIHEKEDLMLVFSFFFAAIICGILTKRIKQQEIELNKLKLKEASKKLHDTLLNSVSHELRTPLTVLIGATTALKENNIYNNSEARLTLTNEIISSAHRLNNVVENLLDVSRIENGYVKLKLEWFTFVELLDDVIGSFPEANRISVNLEGEPQTYILADYVLLSHVFINLISNTVKHSGHRISQAIVFIRREKNRIFISYKDNGRGIANNDMDQIFEKFYKTNESQTGIGLGLAIVKSIIELHGGDIKCLPSQDGVYFQIMMPINEKYQQGVS